MSILINKFTEDKLEQAFIELLGRENIPHVSGKEIIRRPEEVLIKDDLQTFLSKQYQSAGITTSEIKQIIRQLEIYSSSDLYESNKSIMKLISDGFVFKREDPTQNGTDNNWEKYKMSLNTSRKGRIRSTNLQKSHVLYPLFEAVTNSIHSTDKRITLKQDIKISNA